FADFVTTLERRRDAIAPELFTRVVYGGRSFFGRRTINGFRRWSFDRDRRRLRETSGALAMRVRLQRAIGASPRRQTALRPLAPATLANWLSDQTEAMTNLAAWAPRSIVNTAFPGAKGDKFELLNGWRAPTDPQWREAYRRARWYLERNDANKTLEFEL